MDLLDKITAEMGSARPATGSKSNMPSSSSSSSRPPNAWNRPSPSDRGVSMVTSEGGTPAPSDVKPPVMPLFALPGQSMGRIPKRGQSETTGPDPKRRPEVPEYFKPLDIKPVQLNMWKLDISRMDEVLHKILFQVTLVHENETRFELNTGVATVGGDANRQYRQRAQWVLFVNWFRSNKDLFNNAEHHSVAAYDCAETIYVSSKHYTGGFDEQILVVDQSNFSDKDWSIVSTLSRRKKFKFEIRVKSIGTVYTRGEEALTEQNRPELTRCIETITNQILNNGKFYLYNIATFPIDGEVLSEPDEVTIIKGGFSKVPKVKAGENGDLSAMLTVDITSSPFYKSVHFIKFVHAKFNEFSGNKQSGGGGGHRGGHGGRGGHGRQHHGHSHSHDHRRRDDRDRKEEKKEPTFEKRDADDLEDAFHSGRSTRVLTERVSKAVKGLAVEATHLKNTKSGRIILDGLYNGTAENTEFEWSTAKGKKHISVFNYFLEHYSYRLKYPKLPLAFTKRRKEMSFFPLEMLVVAPGQRIKTGDLNSDVQSVMTGKNSLLPADHVRQARDIMENLLRLGKNKSNEYLASFKITLPSSSPMVARAQLLAPPMIKFANNQCTTPDPQKGGKFGGQGKFVLPAKVRSVAIFNMDQNFSRNVQDFAKQLTYHCCDQGMQFEKDYRDWKYYEMSPNDYSETKHALKECLKRNITIAIAIVNEKKPEIHDVLKYYEEKLGQQTIQITTETAMKIMNDRGGKQTMENVLRKFNPKCGGTNFYIEIASKAFGKVVTVDPVGMNRKLFENTQFIGLELSHTGARTIFEKQNVMFEGDPTVVGVAYSLAKNTQLGGFSYFQATREYKMSQIGSKFELWTNAYLKSAKKLPETVVIYRVGSGEGDYEKIIEEVNEMKSAAGKVKAGYMPKFILVLAHRHSHTRLFPERIEGRKPFEQNVPSGTAVEITSFGKEQQEFILCCQHPMIGTSRPTKYTVLVNDAKWSTNELMQITYYLSYGHQVSFAPPAVPDVLYAASNLAKRGHNNFKTYKKLEEMHRDCQDVLKKHDGIINDEDEDKILNMMIEQISDNVNKLTIQSRNFWA